MPGGRLGRLRRRSHDEDIRHGQDRSDMVETAGVPGGRGTSVSTVAIS
jgi:hypothetical protein